ncbi:MAG TPA: saccharopine dehydrogenase NADP-binding domain-containing protein, partial [Anaerolineales bacterium]
MKTILILGGYGATGKLLTKYLLTKTDTQIIIAGRHVEKAHAFADALSNPRLSVRYADAAQAQSFRDALRGVDLCLLAAPTTHQAEAVIRACLDGGADYLDVQFSSTKLEALYRAEEEIRKAGLCFVTEAGYHPGLPSAMVRYAACQMDSIQRAVTAGYLNIGPGLAYTEALDELMEGFIDYNAQIYKDGKWTPPKKWEMIKFDFGGEIGARTCYSMFFEEMRCLPQMYSTLKDTGFYISGSNWIADWLITPIIMAGLKIAPQRGLRPLGKLMWWAMQQSKPPYQVQIAVEAQGSKGGKPITVHAAVGHPDGYELTAIPVVAFLKQYLDGQARLPGLHMMGQIAEPERLLRDMQSMGATVT